MTKPTRVAVLGPTGQVGGELLRLEWPAGVEVIGLGRSALDLENAERAVAALSDIGPATVVNAAAYTAVDKAESEPATAYAVNASGVESLTTACAEVGSKLIHLSTDYVFDGTKGSPYQVDDRPTPLGVYGRSKLAGEHAALSSPGNIVVRTAWVYSASGGNFVKTIRRLAAERDQLGVVNDQIGNPSSATDIAAAVQAIALSTSDYSGIVHAVAPDTATWWELACAVVEELGSEATARVDAITTAEYPTAAPRPADTRLDDSVLADRFGHRLRPWRDALHEVCQALDALQTVD